jgi:hypothetical protein
MGRGYLVVGDFCWEVGTGRMLGSSDGDGVGRTYPFLS